MQYPEEIIHSTITQVAEDLNVADATVFRFCKRIGFKGYQALKISLASEIINPIEDIHETIQEDDSEKEVAQKVFKSNIRTLEESMNLINENNYKEAVNAILHANRIEFYGSGGSGFVAMDAHHKFMRTGLNTIAYNDSHMQIGSAALLTEKDVAVFISHSGANKDLLEVLEVAKATNVKTIGITHLAKSPLSQNVDIALHTISEETDYRSEALASRIAQLSIIDALYVNVMFKQKEKAAHSLQKVRDAIANRRV